MNVRSQGFGNFPADEIVFLIDPSSSGFVSGEKPTSPN